MRREFRLIAGICILIALGDCEKTAGPPNHNEVLHRSLSGEPATLDPAAAGDSFSAEVLRDLYEGLTTESPTGGIVPGVASSWTVDSTGRVYTFKIRPDARWSNGKMVQAQDFVTAWRRVVDPLQGSPVADDLRLLAGAKSIIEGRSPVSALGVAAVDDHTLVVKLEQPVSYLLQILTHAAAYPIYSVSSARSHDPGGSVSNGPYAITSWAPGTSIRMMRNSNYWDRDNVRISQVDYYFMSDENAQYAGFRAGQIDLTDTVPANVLPELLHRRIPELFIAPFLATAYYGFNLSKPPFRDNTKLRMALTMAIDRKKLVTSLGAGQVPAFGFVPPGIANYEPQSWPWKDLSESERTATARQLYAEAGYSVQKPLHLDLLFNSNVGIKNIVIIVAAMWKEVLAIETTLTDEEYRVFLQSRHDKSRWDVVRLGWVADYNDAANFLDTFRAKSVNNDEGYESPEFDALLNRASQSTDSATRRALLETSEKIMLQDYPIIPLYFFVSKRLVKPYVHGFRANPLNHVLTKSLDLDAH